MKKDNNSKKLTDNQKKNLDILWKLRVQLAKDRMERLSRLEKESK